MAKIKDFLLNGIWRIRIDKLPKLKSIGIRFLRIPLLTLREFNKDQCFLRASALTFFTLLSIVPVFAMIFGIAKGFGMEKMLRERLLEVEGQQEVIGKIIEFAEKMLQSTSGGVVAGVGIVVLFWTVIKVLNHIEQAFNHIWGVKKNRTFGRKLGDYLSLMLICPVFIIMSGSVTVFITKNMMMVTEKTGVLGEALGPFLLAGLSIIPYTISWGLLTFLYMFIPNTKVRFTSAFLGAIAGGTSLQVLQWAYIKFQVGAASAGAVYGSFAALPLFLTWLQISWVLVLLGGELSFAHQHERTYEFESDCLDASRSFKQMLAIRVTQMCVAKFIKGQSPVTLAEISSELEVPYRLVREVMRDLVRAKVLSEVNSVTREESYQPARHVDDLTVQFVVEALDRSGFEDVPVQDTNELQKIKESLHGIHEEIKGSQHNLLLKDF